MEIQWPLVLFSLIAGTGGSLFAFVALSELLGGKEKTRFAATVTSLVLIVAGGCLSMLHLASPQNAFAALTNIFSFSGISIELMLLGLTFVVALAYAIVVKRLRNALAAKALAVVAVSWDWPLATSAVTAMSSRHSRHGCTSLCLWLISARPWPAAHSPTMP